MTVSQYHYIENVISLVYSFFSDIVMSLLIISF